MVTTFLRGVKLDFFLGPEVDSFVSSIVRAIGAAFEYLLVLSCILFANISSKLSSHRVNPCARVSSFFSYSLSYMVEIARSIKSIRIVANVHTLFMISMSLFSPSPSSRPDISANKSEAILTVALFFSKN